MAKARILAVDDQRYFRELLEGLLCEEGYEVETVSSAEEALQVLEREAFDVVVTDLVMPGVDGTELVGRIKERLPDQEIVMVTGVVDVKTAVEAMKRGATDYILKPFDRSTLARSLEKILGRRRLRDEHERLMTENLEYMGVLSLYERASRLFSTLSRESLAEQLIVGLCLETRAQGGVLWIVEELGGERLRLEGARGLVRLEEENEHLLASDFRDQAQSSIGSEGSGHTARPRGTRSESNSMIVPLRVDGDLIGLARLRDPLGGIEFGETDLVIADKFGGFGATALANALRFRSLERRAFRDPTTRVYTQIFFEDAVRNEIQKATRFGRSFSIIHVDAGLLANLDACSAGGDPDNTVSDLIEYLASALRSTDLLASRDASHYNVLLPETDALGVAVLKQRMRRLVEQSGILAPGSADPSEALALAAVTYPSDGTDLEALEGVVQARLALDRGTLVRDLSAGEHNFSRAVDRLLKEGRVEPAEVSQEAVRLLLDEVARRSKDRSLLFLSPGPDLLPVVREGLTRLRALNTNTEIVLVGGDGPMDDDSDDMTWVPSHRVGTDRPFALYYGGGPVYALVTAHRSDGKGLRLFHTDDRSLVEHLAFQLQKDLDPSLEGLA
jgi:two-component system cell cycle response regulator